MEAGSTGLPLPVAIYRMASQWTRTLDMVMQLAASAAAVAIKLSERTHGASPLD